MDSITGEKASGWGKAMWVWGETAAGLPGELTVTEAKQDMRADSNSLSSRRNTICSRCCQGIPQRSGCEAAVYQCDAPACRCGFRVIKRHKQNFWVFLSENPRFKETLRVS